jgi:hypothetical protein
MPSSNSSSKSTRKGEYHVTDGSGSNDHCGGSMQGVVKNCRKWQYFRLFTAVTSTAASEMQKHLPKKMRRNSKAFWSNLQ